MDCQFWYDLLGFSIDCYSVLISSNNVGPDNSGSFTIELHHGGFFVGSRNLRSYIDEKLTGSTGLTMIHGLHYGLRISLSYLVMRVWQIASSICCYQGKILVMGSG